MCCSDLQVPCVEEDSGWLNKKEESKVGCRWWVSGGDVVGQASSCLVLSRLADYTRDMVGGGRVGEVDDVAVAGGSDVAAVDVSAVWPGGGGGGSGSGGVVVV
jgi:hypothetical protein